MILHPAGGSLEYLLKITPRIIITHSVAIFSLPFALVGFWGLTKKLGSGNYLSFCGFAFSVFALFAILIAAATNGLVMPIFIQKYQQASGPVLDNVKMVLKYSFSVNNAFDYIYSAAFAVALLFWSAAIIITKKLPLWIAYLGIALAAGAVVLFISGLEQASLTGFRLFVSSIVLWIMAVGVHMVRQGAE